jgi:adenylate cyclase
MLTNLNPLQRLVRGLRKGMARTLLGLAITALLMGHVAGVYHIRFIEQLDNIIYDARLVLTLPGGVDERIVILDIDEKALALPELGRWPWGQDKMATLVNTLFDRYQIRLLGFDAVWAEKDRGSGLAVLQKLAREDLKGVPEFEQALQKLTPQLDHEALFAKALKDRPVVMGYYFNAASDALESGQLPDALLGEGSFATREAAFPKRSGYGANLSSLMQGGMLAGHFNPTIDPDGVIRRVPLMMEYKGQYYESLSLGMVRLLIGLESPDHTRQGRMPDQLPGVQLLPQLPEPLAAGVRYPLTSLAVGPLEVPMDASTNVMVPYRGGRGSYRYISLADVFTGKLPKEALQNKIALVGTTALGLADLRSTPVSAIYPGVEVHANLIAGMISPEPGAIKSMPDFVKGAELLGLAVCGLVLALLLAQLPPLWSLLVTTVAITALAAANLLAWNAGLILPLASVLLLTGLIYVANMAYGYLVEARSKRQFTDLFGQYVPPELVEKMAESPEAYSMDGKKAVLTVLFSDVVGFTSISERLSPQELSAFINEYLTAMSMVIRENGGTLDKYIGDAIMAFWGAPVSDQEHATRGVTAALLMQKKLGELRQSFVARGWPSITVGIGLSSGDMTVGDMGSKIRKAYTVMGDTVNLGSRLEGVTRQYGVGTLVSEETVRLAQGIVFREIDMVRVKGKDLPIRIYEPLALDAEADALMRTRLARWHEALACYRAQQWSEAQAVLQELQAGEPETRLYPIYLERIDELRLNPPPADWDGVKKFESK